MYFTIMKLTWPIQMLVFYAIFLVRATIFAGGGTAWIQTSEWAKKHKVILQDTECRAIWADVLDGLLVIAVDAVVTVLAFHYGWLRLSIDSSPLLIVATFAAMFVWLEIYFYYSHRLLHHPKLFWIHKRHHVRRATNPWTSLSFSVSERFVLLFGAVGIPAVLSHFIPMSIESYFGYFLFNYIFNVYGHLNVETLPTRFVNSRLGRIFFTTTFHALHHSRYRGHYGLFTQVLDGWHGTKFADYEKYHEQVTTRG